MSARRVGTEIVVHTVLLVAVIFALTFLASLPGLCLVPLIASWLPASPSTGRNEPAGPKPPDGPAE